jgi:hypothetical protein
MGKGWGYRVGTKQVAHPLEAGERQRLYLIIECYYDEYGKPGSYTEPNILANWEDFNDLRYTYLKAGRALDQPILDLDNWPNEYKPEL